MRRWQTLFGGLVIALMLLTGCAKQQLTPADRDLLNQALDTSRAAEQQAQAAKDAADRAEAAADRAETAANAAERSASEAADSATRSSRAFEMGQRK